MSKVQESKVDVVTLRLFGKYANFTAVATLDTGFLEKVELKRTSRYGVGRFTLHSKDDVESVIELLQSALDKEKST